MKDSHNNQIGHFGEEYACKYYQSLGFTIKNRNFKTPLGELDIVAIKNNNLYFIEVKTRIGKHKGTPWEQINHHKIKHLKRAICYFCNKNGISVEKQIIFVHICAVTMDNYSAMPIIDYRPLEFSDL